MDENLKLERDRLYYDKIIIQNKETKKSFDIGFESAYELLKNESKNKTKK